MMKKKISTLITICLIIGLFSSCSANPRSQNKALPTTVTVWTYYNGTAKEAFDEMVNEFNQTIGQNKNIIIDAYSQGDVNQLADAVLRAANEDIGAEKLPHVFAAYSDSAYVIDKLGLVANLNDYFSKEDLAQYRDEFIEDGRFGDTDFLKIIPVAKSTENIFINTTDFNVFAKDMGATMEEFSTWEGIAKLSAKYYDWTDAKTALPNDGKALFGVDAMANFMIITARQLGCELYEGTEGNMSVNFPKETAKKIWDNFYLPYVSGHYAAIGRFRSDDAKTGDLLAYTGSTSGAGYFPMQIETGKGTAYPIECAVLPYPSFEGAELFSMHQGAGMVIAKSDKLHEAAAAEFLKWFTDTKQNLKFAVLTGYLPVKNEALNIDLFMKEVAAQPMNPVNNPKVLSTRTTYNMLKDYKLYATKPFLTSYDARKILDVSLISHANADLEQIKAAVADGGDRAEMISGFTTDENFEAWYNKLMLDLKNAMAKNTLAKTFDGRVDK